MKYLHCKIKKQKKEKSRYAFNYKHKEYKNIRNINMEINIGTLFCAQFYWNMEKGHLL